jgi:hypothetical protein
MADSPLQRHQQTEVPAVLTEDIDHCGQRGGVSRGGVLGQKHRDLLQLGWKGE